MGAFFPLKLALIAGLALTGTACHETLDAGHNNPRGMLPVDYRNPVVLYNDSARDNWFGEYAVLMANRGGPPLAGLIVTTSDYWGDLDDNASVWTNLLTAARSSGLNSIPKITLSTPPVLQKPADGNIDATVGTESAGARLIVDLSKSLAQKNRPLVVVGGTRLTDPANAYLLDHTVVDRVVIVASLGAYSAPTATMDGPNGELDPWADWIVSHRFQYVQVCSYYQQTSDVSTSDVMNLPHTPLGTWMMNKQPNIRNLAQASDQIGVLAVALPDFVTKTQRASPDPAATYDGIFGPPLRADDAGRAWVVTEIAGPLARTRLWEALIPATP